MSEKPSGKLDQSLDTIMKESKPEKGGDRRRSRGPRKASVKPAAKSGGGVKKNTKPTKPTVKVIETPPTSKSKIAVSGLPRDVTAPLIKDYFSAAVSPVANVQLNYTEAGHSRGSATVTFFKKFAAAEALKMDGTVVDGKPIKIEVLVNKEADVKSIQARVSKPKNAAKDKPKKAADEKGAAAGEGKGKKKKARTAKPKKTVEDLDVDMDDYWGGGKKDGAANGTAQPAAAATVDEVL